ncbi:DBF4-type zinc finger-containing protein 2 isoform X2 [Dicentrarchus labrax]|uniref:DBF4-type zinc finger-containing protein 2 isoform X2 n=1 Tax=Dicentrarchus labrax TaxID=13489 RepID=UPI0021F5103F|nr:DBF4-type zinc finger-containing protein 2 isoform X2 [Dicentrarchus labrax]
MMSHSSDEGKNSNTPSGYILFTALIILCVCVCVCVCVSDDQRRAESSSRMWAESQPGPSRCQVPSRQGYCGYCRVLYSNLDQHLSSLQHLDSVRASSRGSSTVSSASSKTKLTLLERFLQDVLQHHPHRYKDPRPSHADLPSVSAPPLPREELDEVCFSDDSRSLGTREHLPSSDGDGHVRSQSESVSAPIRGQEEGGTAPAGRIQTPPKHTQTPPTQTQTPHPVHRKAHRKTNRRKTSDSSSSSSAPEGADPGADPGAHPGAHPGPQAPSGMRPWLSWQKERKEAHKEEAFSSDHSDPLDRTIEEEETDSLHFSLPVSVETQSDNWDSPVQVVLQRGQTLGDTPVQVSQMEERDLNHLMDVQVDLEDQVYSCQLDSALRGERREGGGARKGEGFWTLPIEEVLPTPAHIPESFRGKTWAQIEQEDEEKVNKLVQQFRRERFICYFDSESLARYGRRSQSKKGRGGKREVESDTGILPLLDCEEDAYIRRRRRRGFRVASRCQVVKVSHSTQTVRLVVPAVRQPEAPPTSVPAANQDAAERTPDVQTWRCLPPSYSKIITPLQPRTSVVYLLCSPSGPASSGTPAPKRCRKKRRPLDLQGLKVKYKQLPVRFYDPSSNRILKNPPKGFLWRRGSAPSSPPPPCVRQLFRSLSPDLNTDRPLGEGPAESSRVKGQRSSDATFTNSFLLSTLSRVSIRGRGRTTQAPPHTPNSGSEQGRGGRRERTRPPSSTRRTRAQATPPQPRREGLRQAGPGRKVPGSTGSPHPPSPRRGRTRRGRGCDRSRR